MRYLNKIMGRFFLIAFCMASFSQRAKTQVIIPLGGNSFVTVSSNPGNEKVTVDGWENWTRPSTVWSIYFKVPQAGTLQISSRITVPAGESLIKWTIDGISKIKSAASSTNTELQIGEWNITQPGYVKIDVQGVGKTGDLFAKMSEIKISGTAVNDKTCFVKNNDDNYFYWGRRGPSVHINYDISEVKDDIEWFYNEITVPVGSDPIGSYFMANGFSEGYFGFQVNSPSERRILFSVWSPFKTDNPKEIPDDKKIIMLKKGKNVYTGEFGNEGSGGQSYLKYNWKAGVTYGFLLKAKPVENEHTEFTAYFFAPELKKWMLIASFIRPATQTYLKRLHSFLESFDPATGHITRKAYYTNQWVKTKAGEWKPLSQMFLTADATAKKEFRMDYDGGVENGKFYLRNCGFFNESAELRKNYKVEVTGRPPSIALMGRIAFR